MFCFYLIYSSELEPIHEDNLTLFVTNLAFRATEEEIQEFFATGLLTEIPVAYSSVAPVKDVRIVRDRASGRSRGFAYVDCNSLEDLNKVVVSTILFNYLS